MQGAALQEAALQGAALRQRPAWCSGQWRARAMAAVTRAQQGVRRAAERATVRCSLPQLLALLPQSLHLLLLALLLLLLLHQRRRHRLLLLRPDRLQLAALLLLRARREVGVAAAACSLVQQPPGSRSCVLDGA